ncbi:hypothetical protein ACHAW5_002387 [Stephanodiscus triporus]|uniref:WW domain-containing protein n=1 Tax=Stephanodiscus triporus TaxID=2934178 RepID=A0ABD3N8V1_9STRA
MEVAHVLADASSGWDIHSKSGEAKEVDDYGDRWVEYYDESSERYHYYHVETNATQWEKPEEEKAYPSSGWRMGRRKEDTPTMGGVIPEEITIIANEVRERRRRTASSPEESAMHPMSGVIRPRLKRRTSSLGKFWINTGTPICVGITRIASRNEQTLKKDKAKAVEDMSINDYAKSSLAEDNCMVRIITNTTEKKITALHLDVAKEVIGRKCLVGFIDERLGESLKRFSGFFRWEQINSISKHYAVGSAAATTPEKDIDEKRKCANKLVKIGVNRHKYSRLKETSNAWKLLKAKNAYDIELYEYAEALYEKVGFSCAAMCVSFPS